MADIYLCGVHPSDFKGPGRLSKVLEKYKPDAILLDTTANEANVSIDYHQLLATLHKNPDITQRYLDEVVRDLIIPADSPLINRETLAHYMFIRGYPAWVVYGYAKDVRTSQIKFTDHSDFSPEAIRERHFEADLTFLQILSQTPEEHKQSSVADYRQEHTQIPEIADAVKTYEHNSTVANQAIGLRGRRRLVISALPYIFGSSPTIYDMLLDRGKALKVKRFKLIDADKF